MFIRYLTEKHLSTAGFKPTHEINLCPETFSYQKLNYDHQVYTLISLYDNASSYLYKVVVYGESTVEEGMITRPEELNSLMEKYIDNDVISCLERRNGKPFSEIEKKFLRKKLEKEVTA